MKLKELYEKAVEAGYPIDMIGNVGRADEWRDVVPEYADEFLETEGDREIYDFAIQKKQKILIVKFAGKEEN